MEFVSFFGNSKTTTAILIFILFIFLIGLKRLKEATISLCIILSYPYALLLKGSFEKSRPLTANIAPTSPLDYYSFPSTHVVFYTVFWGYVLYLTFKIKSKDKLAKNVLRILSVYFIGMVGLSRVFLGMHWIKDVLGGYFFGLSLLAILMLINEKVTSPRTKKKK